MNTTAVPRARAVFQPSPAAPGFFDQYKYWIVIGVVIVVAVLAVGFLMYQNTQQDKRNKQAQAEYRVLADQYAQRRGEELGKQMALKMVNDYLKRPGARHDLGDPGILPDLGCVSDWETNVNQRAAPDGTAVTTDVTQIGSTAPPPIDGPGSVRLNPANANSEFQGQVEAPGPSTNQSTSLTS